MCAPLTACHEELGLGKASTARTRVESLTLSGIESIDESQLRRALATRASSWLPWRETRYFDLEEFKRDLERIPAYYGERGYRQARVRSFDIELTPDGTGVHLFAVIDEGPPTRVAALELDGFDMLSVEERDELRARAPLQSGDAVDREALLATTELAAMAVRNDGYAYARVTADEMSLTGEAPRVTIRLRADPGVQAWFGPIDIVGNTSVDDDVIRAHLGYRPGEIFREDVLQASVRRLYALELFEFATIEQVGSRFDSEIGTRVTVTEGDHRKIELSVGYGSEERLRGEAEWRHVNFFGGARTLRLHGKASWLDRGIEGQFVQPALFHPDLTLTLAGQTWLTDEQAYTALRRGGRAALTRALGQQSSIAFTTRSEYQRSDIGEQALRDPELRDDLIALGLDPTSGRQSGQLTAVGIDTIWQSVDDPRAPRRGYGLTLALEQAGTWLPSSFDYFSLIAGGRAYASPRDWLTFAGRVRYGAIDAFGESEPVPFFKRFFLGGASSLRGWGRFEVAPLAGGVPIGGESVFEASAEVRANVIGDLGLVAFVDAGRVWRDPWAFDGSSLLYDAGPGLRYDTPVGPIRVDFAYQLNTLDGLLVDGEPQRRRWRIHFGIGHAF